MGVILNNLIPIIGSSIAMSIPLVLASVGGAFSVRSGIMALGLESMMMMGAFFGVLGSYFTGSVLFGFLLGMVGGMVPRHPVRALQGQPGHQRHRTEPAGSGRHHPADAAHLE